MKWKTILAAGAILFTGVVFAQSIVPDPFATNVEVTSANNPTTPGSVFGVPWDLVKDATDPSYVAPNASNGGGGTSYWTNPSVNTITFYFDGPYTLNTIYLWDYYRHTPKDWMLIFYDESGSEIGTYNFSITVCQPDPCSKLHERQFGTISNVWIVAMTNTIGSPIGGVGLSEIHFGITDNDGDGFPPGEGYDCNDYNPAINPGAYEIPGNVIDENCDGDIGDCSPCYDWKNHGTYVRCVAHAVEDLVNQGLISEDEGDVLVSSGAQTEIGKKDFTPEECLQ